MFSDLIENKVKELMKYCSTVSKRGPRYLNRCHLVRKGPGLGHLAAFLLAVIQHDGARVGYSGFAEYRVVCIRTALGVGVLSELTHLPENVSVLPGYRGQR